MIEESISRVKKAEQQAEEIVRKAREESSRILEDARKEAETQKQRRILETESSIAEELQAMLVKGEEQQQKARKEAEEEAAVLKHRGEEKEQQAVKAVLKILLD